jgi:hypothetical protein
MNDQRLNEIEVMFGEGTASFFRCVTDRIIKDKGIRLIAENNDLAHFSTWLEPVVKCAIKKELLARDRTVDTYMNLPDEAKILFNNDVLGMRKLWQDRHKEAL